MNKPLEELSLEELVDLLPGRNKYWSDQLPESMWSNDWWCAIEFTWVRDGNGKMVNGWGINYYNDYHTPLMKENIFARPRKAVIQMLEYLTEQGLWKYEQ